MPDGCDDSSRIPSEWHGWLHYTYDSVPGKDEFFEAKWLAPHTGNLTGTPHRYMPYSTTDSKIQAWSPPLLDRRSQLIANPVLPKE